MDAGHGGWASSGKDTPPGRLRRHRPHWHASGLLHGPKPSRLGPRRGRGSGRLFGLSAALGLGGWPCSLRACTFGTPPARVYSCEECVAVKRSALLLSNLSGRVHLGSESGLDSSSVGNETVRLTQRLAVRQSNGSGRTKASSRERVRETERRGGEKSLPPWQHPSHWSESKSRRDRLTRQRPWLRTESQGSTGT